MIYLPYTLEELSSDTRRRFAVALWALLPFAAAPYLIFAIQTKLGYDTKWFNDWLHPIDTSHDFVCGIYLLVSGLAILLAVKLSGDFTLGWRKRDIEMYRELTNPRWGGAGLIMTYGTIAGTLIMGLGVFRIIAGITESLTA